MVWSTVPVIQFQIIPCDTSRKSVILKPYILPQVSSTMWYTDTATTRQERRNEEIYQSSVSRFLHYYSTVKSRCVWGQDNKQNEGKLFHTGSIVLPTLYRRFWTADTVQQILHCRQYTVVTSLQKVYSRYCTADSIQQILHCRQYTADTALQTVYSRYCIADCMQQILHCRQYTADTALQTVYSRYCTADSIQQIPHFRHYTVNSALQALYSRWSSAATVQQTLQQILYCWYYTADTVLQTLYSRFCTANTHLLCPLFYPIQPQCSKSQVQVHNWVVAGTQAARAHEMIHETSAVKGKWMTLSPLHKSSTGKVHGTKTKMNLCAFTSLCCSVLIVPQVGLNCNLWI